MATTAFMCDEEESLRIPMESLGIPLDGSKNRHRVSLITRLQVFQVLLVLLVIGLSGWIVWLNLSKELRPQSFRQTFNITGAKTNFIAPCTGKYLIYGEVWKKNPKIAKDNCIETFILFHGEMASQNRITKQNFNGGQTVRFIEDDVDLKKGTEVYLHLNCDDIPIDEAKSRLKVYAILTCHSEQSAV